MTAPASIHVHHPTSHACHFFGRDAELALLDGALGASGPSVIALLGPGGQGKTAIVQHWLESVSTRRPRPEGVFLWSFYRGKNSDECLRALYAAVAGLENAGDVSASYCVDHLLPLLRARRWVVVLDGSEVVQHEPGPWAGRFVHPELGRLLEELASAPQPGVTVVTSRFAVPELERRPAARIVCLEQLDATSARRLLTSLGVHGGDAELDAVAEIGGWHAKAVELLGTFLVRFHGGDARGCRSLPEGSALPDLSAEERRVLRVLSGFQALLSAEEQDILALATAFRDPPTEARLLEYLASPPVQTLTHETWRRTYIRFAERPAGWLDEQLQGLIQLRLLERVVVAVPGSGSERPAVIDAHPLVRRGFEHVLGPEGRRGSATARAGFLSGRPDRNKPATLDEARDDVELFHAYCQGGLWDEADRVLLALDKPRYRFLAPAFERDLRLQFFPNGDWRQPPLWPGFRHFRALAICFELLGAFEEALDAYPAEEAALLGDALLALGRLKPLLTDDRPRHPWNMLWQAYRAHALSLAGQTEEAVSLCGRLVPSDLYEWTHVFECLLRTGRLDLLDVRSFLYRPPHAAESHWDTLGRQRMGADYLRLTGGAASELQALYEELLDGYDRGGLIFERTLTRLSYGRWLLQREDASRAADVNATTQALARRHGMRVMAADAWSLERDIAQAVGDRERAARADVAARQLRAEMGYAGPERP